MARLIPVTFDMYFQTNFSTAIRGHHVYKGSWKPEIGEDQDCCRDEREEAYLHDKHVIGVYKLIDSKKQLFGHVLIERHVLIEGF